MKHFKTALRYAFSRHKKTLASAALDGDAAMTAYLLECNKRRFTSTELGLALIGAVGAANARDKDWLRIAKNIRQQPQAPGIEPYVIGSCLVDCAAKKDIPLAQILLSFPQVAQIKNWDDVLFNCLPKGDPEKKRIEKRDFVDTDGSPEILTMVKQAMAAPAPVVPKPPAPRNY
jgi:hypothetical protein